MTETSWASRPAGARGAGASDDGPHCVLVVDDDQAVRQTLELVLTIEGFDVVHAGDGREAIDATRRYSPDVILMDVMMPGQDGFATTRELRRCDASATTPVIAVTALSSDRDVWRGWQSGIDSYVCKPFDSELLVNEIQRLIEAHETADRSMAERPDAV